MRPFVLICTLLAPSPAFAQVAAPAASAEVAATAANPVLAPWTGPYGGVPPWDRIRPELFPQAFEAAIAEIAAVSQRLIVAVGGEVEPGPDRRPPPRISTDRDRERWREREQARAEAHAHPHPHPAGAG